MRSPTNGAFHGSSWAEADTFLRAGRTHESRQSRKIANNTYLVRDCPVARGHVLAHPDDVAYHESKCEHDIVVVLHSTDVVRYRHDGTTVLRTGGWHTRTTNSRLNYYARAAVYSHRGTWWLHSRGVRTVPFHDGIVVDSDGRAVA